MDGPGLENGPESRVILQNIIGCRDAQGKCALRDYVAAADDAGKKAVVQRIVNEINDSAYLANFLRLRAEEAWLEPLFARLAGDAATVAKQRRLSMEQFGQVFEEPSVIQAQNEFLRSAQDQLQVQAYPAGLDARAPIADLSDLLYANENAQNTPLFKSDPLREQALDVLRTLMIDQLQKANGSQKQAVESIADGYHFYFIRDPPRPEPHSSADVLQAAAEAAARLNGKADWIEYYEDRIEASEQRLMDLFGVIDSKQWSQFDIDEFLAALRDAVRLQQVLMTIANDSDANVAAPARRMATSLRQSVFTQSALFLNEAARMLDLVRRDDLAATMKLHFGLPQNNAANEQTYDQRVLQLYTNVIEPLTVADRAVMQVWRQSNQFYTANNDGSAAADLARNATQRAQNSVKAAAERLMSGTSLNDKSVLSQMASWEFPLYDPSILGRDTMWTYQPSPWNISARDRLEQLGEALPPSPPRPLPENAAMVEKQAEEAELLQRASRRPSTGGGAQNAAPAADWPWFVFLIIGVLALIAVAIVIGIVLELRKTRKQNSSVAFATQ